MPEHALPERGRAWLDDLPASTPGRADALVTARSVWRALGSAGVLRRLYQPGPRPQPRQLAELLSELDARYDTGVVLSVCVQVATALPMLAGGGSRPVVKDAHEAALDGEMVLAVAATDAAAAGSDLMDAGTRVALGAGLVVDGAKRWITNACTADAIVVLARHRPERHFTSFTWVLVPGNAEGVVREPAATSLFAGSGVGHLGFHEVRLTEDHLVGSPGRGLVDFARHVETERLASALWATAICRRVLAATHRHLAGRYLGGRPLWDNDAVRERFARCVLEWWRLRELTAGRSTAPDGPDGRTAAMLLKAASGTALDTVLTECARLHGADAFGTGAFGADAFGADGLARLRAEAAMFGIAGGATEAMLAAVAEAAGRLLGLGQP